MIVPAAMEIYEGAALLRSMSPEVRADHSREFHAAFVQVTTEEKIEATPEAMFLLGLSTARAIVHANPKISQAEADKLL